MSLPDRLLRRPFRGQTVVFETRFVARGVGWFLAMAEPSGANRSAAEPEPSGDGRRQIAAQTPLHAHRGKPTAERQPEG